MARAERAVRRARRSGEAGAGRVHGPGRAEVDPSAVVFASRRPRRALVLLRAARSGRVRARRARQRRARWRRAGPTASARRRRWRGLSPGAVADAPDGPAGAGLVAVGGFAFAPAGGAGAALGGLWGRPADCPGGRARRRGRDGGSRSPRSPRPTTCRRALRARSSARPRSCAPAAAGVAGSVAGRELSGRVDAPPDTSRRRSRAPERIRAGGLEKIVLARKVTCTPRAARPGGRLRRAA